MNIFMLVTNYGTFAAISILRALTFSMEEGEQLLQAGRDEQGMLLACNKAC